MKSLHIKPLLFAALAAFAALPAFAAELSPQVAAVRDRWAEVKYEVPADQRVAAFEALANQAKAARAAAPRDAGALIWEGIVLSSWAGEKGGLGALGLVKQARKDFEAALAVEPTALEGSAYTSLGSLYYQVPGWPVGFGDDEKAEKLLKQALAINPTGIAPNFFYGDFLLDQGDKAQAKVYLDKALAAPARPGREVADEGRRMEIRERLAKL